MRRAHSSVYDMLAVAAARAAGFDPAGAGDRERAIAIAADAPPAALEARDAAWAELETMILDERTYRIRDIVKFLAERWAIKFTRTGVHGLRQRLAEKDRVNRLASLQLKRAFELLEDLPLPELLTGGRKMIGKLILSTLMQSGSGALSELKPGQVVAMMDVFVKLAKTYAETGLIDARTSQLQDKLDAAKAAADRAAQKTLAADGVSEKTIDRIRQIYGLPKLADLPEAAGDAA